MTRRPESVARTARWRTELQVSVFLCTGRRIGRRPAHVVVVERAQRAGLAGATAIHGFQGFGRTGTLSHSGALASDGFEPVLVQLADVPERVQAFLPELQALVGDALIVTSTVRVARQPPRTAAAGR